ncbi:NADH:flavin oxidoreductase/NADH oxidase [Massilia antarctica]|uniref:NADH:flavin oxidoreductase/NADH oxidase n=1 Tax=Massilia antarctica TaxID=2765360 RepID=UPI0006BB5BAE|nr:NADH:flavin oxidoreductase/NADH oxidase [Massilia sp. H27-R4]MCY0912451.1 NADH:flavin oxidoreductase/NADH oxidase [Massilia sp. H27-R4]CUI03365.1 NADH:flavin oxidoreductase/NADH oxidase [Janthinobacterium sp. CG23_2]CUU27151.1 NADH:flavin oxidoreductase/NADH oxidase [Janthinobacterium sp. CG23_2]
MSKLFEPLTLRGVTLRNRFALSPMCQYTAKDGCVSDYHTIHYGRFALGGFGLLMVEATAVSPEGRITHGDLGLWDDAHIPGLARIAAFAKAYGATPGIQIGHAGPKASIQRAFEGNGPLTAVDAARGEPAWPVVSPSARPVTDGWLVPTALDANGIAKVCADFIASARRAMQAGFDVLELHYAHGFLLNAFLSPLTNDRSDEYGGSFENRIRLPLRIARQVREVWPRDKPLFVRLSAVDGSGSGWTIADSVAFAEALKAVGVDVIDCSSGGFGVYEYPSGYGFQVPFAAQIRRQAHIGTMAVGIIVDPRQAESIIASGQADLVALGHAALRDPHFPLHAQQTLGAVGPDAAYADWNVQAGWWLDHRASKLVQLGPWAPMKDAAANGHKD